MNLNTIIEKVSLTKVCSIKADKESSDSKSITLNVKFDGVPLSAVFAKAVSGAVIQWQNGPGRNKFDQWKSGEVVNIDFKSPGQTQIDPLQALITSAKAEGIDVTDKHALTNYIMANLPK